MKRFSLRTLLFACVAVAVFLGIFRESIIDSIKLNADRYPMTLISNEEELAEAILMPRSIVLINADWSVNAKISRIAVEKFARDWRWRDRKPELSFYMIDITDKNPDLDIFRLGKTDPRLAFIHGGYGDVIWFRNGKVKLVHQPRIGTNPEVFAAWTRDAFAE